VLYHSGERIIEIRTNIPTRFRISVQGIDVTVEETTTQVGDRYEWGIR
jgi:hypothetical protein